MSTLIVTPKFRVSYPHVFRPKLNNLSKKMEYSVVAVFPLKTDFKKFEETIKKVIEEKWPDPKKRPKNIQMPLKDNELRADKETGKLAPPYEEGGFHMNLVSKPKNDGTPATRPGIVNQQAQPIMDESEFYAGCFAQARISVFAWEYAGKFGVGVGLDSIQKVAEGAPLTSRVKAEDFFKPVEEEESDDLYT